MRARISLVVVGWLTLSACETVSEKLAGQLVQVTVVTVSDTCIPRRAADDGGVQFFAMRPDGGAIFSASLYTQFGPNLDGGGIDSTRTDSIPPSSPTSTLGTESACAATTAAWSFLDAGLGLQLDQVLPGIDVCPSGPGWLPSTSCASTRQFHFDPIRACSLQCVHVSAAGDVSCDC